MEQFQTFSDHFHDYQSSKVNDCVFKGIDRNLDVLPDPSESAIQRRLAIARSLLDQARSISKPELDLQQQIDIEIAERMLLADIHDETYEFNGLTTAEQRPTAADDVSDPLFQFFINDPREPAERIGNICNRLQQVPDFLAGSLRRLKQPVGRWAELEEQRVDGLPDLFNTLSNWVTQDASTDVDQFKAAVDQANVAFHDYRQQLGKLPRIESFHVGNGTTETILKLRGIELSPTELKQMASEFLADTGQVIDELSQMLIAKYKLDKHTTVEALELYLNQQFAVSQAGAPLSEILDSYKEEHEKILDFISQRQLFPLPDNQQLKILQTPEFMVPNVPAGAMQEPPSFRAGTATSLVYLTLSEALRDEHTRLSIPGMMIHEGIPGHHLQLSWAARNPSIIRRHCDSADLAEGWTTMLEDYMLDQGYMQELTDEARLLGKRDIARIGARVAIDLYFMTGDKSYLEVGVDCDLSSDDPFVAAGSLLAAVTGFVPQRVQAELNWYSQERGYPLSYLVGNKLVWQLKKQMQKHKSAEWDSQRIDQEFHKAFLEAGNMPVATLRRLFAAQGLTGRA